MWGICAEQWIAIVAGFQAVFAGCLLWVAWRQKNISNQQTDIMQDQKDISAKQVNLTQDMYELTRFSELRKDYVPILVINRRFLSTLKNTYEQYMENAKFKQYMENAKLTESFELMIEETDFPTGFDPVRTDDLKNFIIQQQDAWTDVKLWRFIKLLFPSSLDLENDSDFAQLYNQMHNPNIVKYANEILLFWQKWLPQLANIRRYILRQPKDPIVLVMLTWIRLAQIQNNSIFGVLGEREFFKFAKCEWSSHEKSYG